MEEDNEKLKCIHEITDKVLSAYPALHDGKSHYDKRHCLCCGELIQI